MCGKDTLHDTVGIAYQIVSEEESTVEESSEPEYVREVISGNKRRRAFQATGLDIEPYRKKPRMLMMRKGPLNLNHSTMQECTILYG